MLKMQFPKDSELLILRTVHLHMDDTLKNGFHPPHIILNILHATTVR